jgi:hypothetical protein
MKFNLYHGSGRVFCAEDSKSSRKNKVKALSKFHHFLIPPTKRIFLLLGWGPGCTGTKINPPPKIGAQKNSSWGKEKDPVHLKLSIRFSGKNLKCRLASSKDQQ